MAYPIFVHSVGSRENSLLVVILIESPDGFPTCRDKQG